MNGKIIPHTPIAVDFWQVRKCAHVRLFFLSHMHSDHTSGLSSTWSNRPIYCSPVTAKLLKLKLHVKDKWIHPLELSDPHQLALDDIGKERMTVTLMDANHCPGAVMFLFEGYFGNILYTGDFRYAPSMLRESCLRTQTTIDVLYLDNTNCDPTRTLPTRQRATQQVKEIIRAHPGHRVVIGLYSLGKESLLVDLALEFKTWVEVSPERLEILLALELPDVFTTEPGAGRIRVVDQDQIRAANLLQWNQEEPTIAILPTSRPMVSCHPNVHVVPYSDHSSYQELEDFLSALRPISIVPIVGTGMPSFSAVFSPRKKRRKTVVPESVLRYMTMSPTPDEVSARCPTGGQAFRGVRSAPPRGVVFESPQRPRKRVASDREASVAEDTDSTVTGSDCILLDMERDSIIDVESEVSLRLVDEGSEVSLRLAEDKEKRDGKRADMIQSPGPLHAVDACGDGAVQTSAASEGNSPNRTTPAHPERGSSLECISLHDNTFVTASAATAVTPRIPSQSPLLSQASAQDTEEEEQWLLEHLVFPEEELNPGSQVVVGLGRIYNLCPLNGPKRMGDPFEAAIERFKAALR